MQHSVIVKCTSFHVVAASDWPKSSWDNLGKTTVILPAS